MLEQHAVVVADTEGVTQIWSPGAAGVAAAGDLPAALRLTPAMRVGRSTESARVSRSTLTRPSRPRTPRVRPILRGERSARCGAGGRCRCYYWRGGPPEGPARARSSGAAPTARQVAGAGIARRGEPGGLRCSGYSSPQVDGFAGRWSPGGAPSTVFLAAIPPRAAPAMPPTIAPGGPPTIAPVTSPAMAPTMAPPNAASL